MYLTKKTYLNIFQNTIPHVKFPEEFESFIRIRLRSEALCNDLQEIFYLALTILHFFGLNLKNTFQKSKQGLFIIFALYLVKQKAIVLTTSKVF